MVTDNAIAIGAAGALVFGSVIFALIALVSWRYFYVSGKQDDGRALTDGAVLLVSDGVVHQASISAQTLLGPCIGTRLDHALRQFLGANAAATLNAIDRLESTGEPLYADVSDEDGHQYELIGRPCGAMIRLVLRESRFIAGDPRGTEHRDEAADDPSSNESWAHETMRALIADGPIIAWHRTSDGAINWSGGEIRARNGSVSADQAVKLIVARTKLNRQPVLAGHPQKSRIEIVVSEGTETLSLHVTEILRPDGSWVGFATDAGTAAAAERTLTRFVQTMTETFAHLTVGLAIFDRNQTLALFNPALVQMWQVEPAWLARRPSLRDIIDELRATRRLPELQDFHKWRARLVDLFENTEAADYEELWHLADGSNIRVLARPHPHGSLAFIFDDVTERMRLEQRYRHSIDLRRATLDRMTEGIAVFGPNGLLQFVNQAFHDIWGTNGDVVYTAMHARHLLEICEKLTDEPRMWQRLHGYITGEETRHAWSAKLSKLSGGTLMARIAPLPDGSTMAVFTDVTEAEGTDLALAERTSSLAIAEATQNTVADMIAEEMRARLVAIASLADEVTRLGTSEEVRVRAARIAAAAQGLADSACEIADLAQSPFRSAGQDATICDLRDVLENTAQLLSRQAESAGVELRHEPTTDHQEIACKAGRVHHLAFGLITDAIDRCAAGGTVAFSGSTSGSWVEIMTIVHRPRQDAATAAVGSEAPMQLVRQIVDGTGGTIHVSESAERILVTCRFPTAEATNSRRGNVAEDTKQSTGNVHRLNSTATG